MSITGFLLVLLFQAPPGFSNLDFEKGEVGKVPPGWIANLLSTYRVYLEDTGAKQGNYCIAIERGKIERLSASGKIRQLVNAKPFRGKRLVFRSFVRTEPDIANNQARLFVAVFRKDSERLFFNNNNDHTIRTKEWKEYEISASIAEDARKIDFGLILEGDGKAYWDAIRVEVLDVSSFGNEPARPLEGRVLENVVAFSRLLGYLRYFYPGDETLRKTNWERFAIDGIRVVEPAKSPEDLARVLEEWCGHVAPAVRLFPSSRAEEAMANFSLPKEGAIGTIYWRHRGVEGDRERSEMYRSERIHAFFDRKEDQGAEAPSPEKPYFADLGGGISCLIPLALFLTERGPRPLNWDAIPMEAPPRAPNFYPSGNDRATRLANVAMAWNVFQHFYPYFDVVKTDWLAVLPRTLQAAATDPDEIAFLRTLRRMVAELHDGHGWVSFTKEPAPYVPPIAWDWVEGKLVVTKTIESEAEGVEPGDIVLAVDGVPAEKSLVAEEQFISSATPQWARFRALELLLEGDLDSILSLDLKTRSGAERKVSFPRRIAAGSARARSLRDPRPKKTAVLEPGIVYVDIDRVSDEDFRAFLPELEKAKGIIFDFRGYPSELSFEFVQHLFDRPFRVLQAFVPIVRFPDQRQFAYTGNLNSLEEPLEPHLKTRMVFLTDGRAISKAERFLVSIESYRIGEIIGGPTAGTNGTINQFALAGGYQVTWTGMRTLKPGGALHHGVGVLPTISVSRSIQGVVAGKDEILERGVQILSR